jgi:hypothetical protein
MAGQRAFRQQPQDPQARRVGKRFEQEREIFESSRIHQ